MVLAGKYRVERMLGRGGMGFVVAATHIELRMAVALKFLSDRYTRRPDIVQRFLREARAAATLRSAHVCRVSDVGRLDDGTPFIVMELLVGRDLSKMLRGDGPLAPALAADYVAQACDAVAEAHEAGIVHRDLKPGNLFLTQRRDGSALLKVLDFGVAKVHSEEDHAITTNDSMVGSPQYMAPEQLRSARLADARSDIWSLGIVLHQLVTGVVPFQGETIADLMMHAAFDPLPPLVGVNPEYAAIVARCLEKQPERRFQSVAELASALTTLAGTVRRPPSVIALPSPETESTAIDSPPVADPATRTETTLRSAASSLSESPPSRRRMYVIAGTAAVISICIGTAVLFNDGSTQPPPPAATVAPATTAIAPAAAPVAPPVPVAPVAAPAPVAPAAPVVPTSPVVPTTPVVPAASASGSPARTHAGSAAQRTATTAVPAKPAQAPSPAPAKHAHPKAKEDVGASRF